MARKFQLLKDDEPQVLADIDRLLWDHFEGGEPEGNERWYCEWFHIIGIRLACGDSFDTIINELQSPELIEIAKWLSTRYVVNSWGS